MSSGDIIIRDVSDLDIPFIYQWENDEKNWAVSERTSAYSLDEILALVDSANDFFETQQKRWMIVLSKTNVPIGTVDIFQGELPNQEAGLGILIADESLRSRGYGQTAVTKAMELAEKEYNIHTFHVLVHSDNLASIQLFKKCGFQSVDLATDNFNFDLKKEYIIKLSKCLKK